MFYRTLPTHRRHNPAAATNFDANFLINDAPEIMHIDILIPHSIAANFGSRIEAAVSKKFPSASVTVNGIASDTAIFLDGCAILDDHDRDGERQLIVNEINKIVNGG
jgi:hypothetical protein